MIKKTIITTVFALYACSANSLSLEECLIHTYLNNPELNAKRKELEAIDEKMSEAFSGFLPNIRFESTINTTKHSRYTSSNILSPNHQKNGELFNENGMPKQRDRLKSNSIVLEQALFSGGATVASLEKAKYTISEYRARLKKTENQILFQAVQAYNNVIYTQETVKANKENKNYYNHHLSAIRDRFNAGISDNIDVSVAINYSAEAENQLIDAKLQEQRAIERFRTIIGLYPKNLQKPNLPVLPKNLDDAKKLTNKINPDILIAKNSKLSADVATKEVISSMLPNLVLRADSSARQQKFRGGFNTSPIEGKKYRSHTVAIQFTMPLFQRGIEYSNMRRASSIQSNAKLALIATTNQVNEMLVASYKSNSTAANYLVASKNLYLSSVKAINGLQQKYDQGIVSLLDFLNYRRKFFNDNLTFLRAKKNRVDSAYQYRVAIGQLTARDLGLKTKYYDETKNINKFLWNIL